MALNANVSGEVKVYHDDDAPGECFRAYKDPKDPIVTTRFFGRA
ncbi:MAG: hypothetical protein CM15mP83_5550 [Flavobacteriaceae bacterium]|nr:MAG: hypothetical protein CM15mP83_5550 [Flavobacteriaceae bacterium]